MRRIAVLASCVLMWPVAAAAQISGSASGFSDAPTTANEREYWDMMGALGGCLAQQKSEQAAAFVRTTIDSRAEDEAFTALFHPQRNVCLGNFVAAGMLRAHARGLVAEGLFERMPGAAFAKLVAAPPAAPDNIVTLHDVARCFTVANPVAARDLLAQTRVATKGEQTFVRAASAQFAPCLPVGREFTLRPTSMRMAIAEALYRAASGLPAPTIETRN